MSSDSEDDMLFAQISQLVTTDSNSVLLQYPGLFGLKEVPERHGDNFARVSKFSSSPDDFHSQFSMSRQCFADFMSKLGNKTKICNLEKKLLFSILMLTSQETFEALGKRFNYSKSTAHLAFREVLDGILALFPDYVRWPSVNEYQEISQAFKDKSGGYIPGIVGTIGACHFEIKTPNVDADEYRNTKNTYSIILQAVCDHRKIFTDVYVGSPGSRSEGVVFLESNLCEQMEALMPGEYHMVGESMFPLMRNLVVPFRETGNLRQHKQRFNRILRNAIIVIEQAFAALRGKFKKLRSIETSNPEMANRIICSCLTLHNHTRMYEDVEDNHSNVPEGNSFISHNEVFDEDMGDSNQDRKKVGYIKRNFLMSLCD